MKYSDIFYKTLPGEKLDEKILNVAFTHASVAGKDNTENNEKLEFLGDSVINFLSTKFLMKKFEDKSEGELSKFRANLVCTKTLSKVTDNLNLADNYAFNGELSEKMKADLFEAFIGAVYLSINKNKEEGTAKFLNEVLFKPFSFEALNKVDYKTMLQEKLQESGPLNISYISKPKYVGNKKLFEVTLYQNNVVMAEGVGKSIKQAEEMAAKFAIEKLK